MESNEVGQGPGQPSNQPSSPQSNQETEVPSAPVFSEPFQQEATSVPLRHSGLGIASFVLSITMYVVILAGLVFAVRTVGGAVTDGTVDQTVLESAIGTLSMVGLSMIVAGIGIIVALVLGIVGLAQKQRRKAFAVIGTVLSGLALFFVLGAVVLGLLAGSMAPALG